MAAGLLSAMTGCGGDAPKPAPKPPPAPPPEKVWSSEEIAKDPAGYLLDQDLKVEKQIEERSHRLQQIQERRAGVQGKRSQLAQNLKSIENVRDRLTKACQKADDEERWPARMGGQTFDKPKAEAILRSCETYLSDRKPLDQAYEQTLQRLGQLESQARKQTQDLQRLRERIALDVERIRLNQGLAELGDIRQAEQELASFSKMLGDMDQNVLNTTTARSDELAPVDVEQMLK